MLCAACGAGAAKRGLDPADRHGSLNAMANPEQGIAPTPEWKRNGANIENARTADVAMIERCSFTDALLSNNSQILMTSPVSVRLFRLGGATRPPRRSESCHVSRVMPLGCSPMSTRWRWKTGPTPGDRRAKAASSARLPFQTGYRDVTCNHGPSAAKPATNSSNATGEAVERLPAKCCTTAIQICG